MQEKGGCKLLDISPLAFAQRRTCPCGPAVVFPKPPVRRTSLTMSDCEGLPVGKRQIYIYPGVLPPGSHSQIAKSHAKPLCCRREPEPPQGEEKLPESTADAGAVPPEPCWRAGEGGNAWAFSEGAGAG